MNSILVVLGRLVSLGRGRMREVLNVLELQSDCLGWTPLRLRLLDF